MTAAALSDHQIAITIWESLTNPQGQRLVLQDWNAVFDLPEWLNPPELPDKLLGRGWSPATFASDRRAKRGVERVCALALDYEAPDGQLPTSLDEAIDLWSGFLGWIHTTYSHTAESPRFRVVLPLSRSVSAEEHAVLWRWAATRCAEAGHQIDESCRDASRLWFLPSVRPGAAKEYVLRPLGGSAWLDADKALREQRAAEAPPERSSQARDVPRERTTPRSATPEDHAARFVRKALEGAVEDIRRAPQGTRHNTIRVKAYHLAGYIHTGAIDAETIERELMAAAASAGWDRLDKTRDTVRYQIQAGQRVPKQIPEPRAASSSSSSGGRGAPRPEPLSLDDGEDFPASSFRGHGTPATGSSNEPDTSWRAELLSRRGEVTSELANFTLILEHDPHWRGRIRLNEDRQRIELLDAHGAWRPWQDTDDTEVAIWFQRAWRLRARPEAVCQAVALLAQRRRCSPLATWLRSLRWDGTPRLDTWLTTYAGAPDSPYTRAIGACWLRSAVARALAPGVKADAMLVLEGRQGAGKSSLLRVIGGEHFTDDVHDLASRDTALAIARSWIVELPELSSLGRAEVELVKAFLSRQVDRFRPPYGRAIVELPRRCVFGGTTNRLDYLRDDTGNRRFWPTPVSGVDLDALARDRELLLAEAVASWQAGAPLFPSEESFLTAHLEEVEARRSEDPWEVEIAQWLADRDCATTADVLGLALQIPTDRWSRGDQMRVGQILARLGWRKRRVRVGNDLVWRYLRGGP